MSLDAASGIPTSALPAEIRQGSQKQQDTYRTAMSFEQSLLQEILKPMTQSADMEDSPYASTITQSMTSAISAGGGIGLADSLYRSMLGVDPASSDTMTDTSSETSTTTSAPSAGETATGGVTA